MEDIKKTKIKKNFKSSSGCMMKVQPLSSLSFWRRVVLKFGSRSKWVVVGLVAGVVIATVGSVAALNGWFGGGGSIPEDTFTRGLVGYWSFDEGSGSMAYDASGNGNDGTLNWMTTNTDAWTDGKVGGALQFDGSDDYVEVPNNSSSIRDYSEGVTVCLWFKANRVDVAQGQFGQNGPGYLNLYMPSGTGYTNLRWETDAGQNFYSNTRIYPNTWYFACGVYDTSLPSNQAKLYTNGVLDKQATLTFTTTKTADITIGGYNPTNYLFNGIIDEARIYNRALSAEEVRYHYNRGGPVAHWKFNEGSGSTAYDSTNNNNDGTLYGEMATSTSPGSGWTTGKHGSALSFDGTDDYVEVPDDASLDFANNFTLETWFKIDTAQNYAGLIQKGGFKDGYVLWLAGGSGLTPRLSLGNTTDWILNLDASSVSTGQWYHLAVTIDSSRHGVIYLNGTNVGEGDASDDVSSSSGDNLLIGKSYAEEFNGLIDDVRIYNYARTPEEIRLDYNAGYAARFGPLSDCKRDPGSCMTEGLVGYWDFEEGSGSLTSDKSGNGNDGTLTNGPEWAGGIVPLSGGKEGGGALQFDGTDDYVDIGAGKFDDLANGTLEAWIKRGATAGDDAFISYYKDNSNRSPFFIRDTDGKAYFEIIVGGVNHQIYSDSALSQDTWYHVAVTFGSGGMKMYINGVQQADTDSTTLGWDDITPSVSNQIGTHNLSAYFLGLIDEVRIYNRALSAEEIRYHYNRGGPVAHWKFDEGSGSTVYDSTENNKDGTAIASPQWVVGKYGSALEFDGVWTGSGDTTQHVKIPDDSILRPTRITLSAWIYPTDTSGTRDVIGKWRSNPKTGYQLRVINGELKGIVGVDGVDREYTAGTIQVNTWTHVSMTYDGRILTLYVNGTAFAKDFGTVADIAAETRDLQIADYWFGTPFAGKIDDIRIYNYARTAEQIRQDYNEGLAAHFGPKTDCDSDPGACMTKGLVGYWDFEEGSGSLTSDKSGNGNDGILGGGTASYEPDWAGGIVPLSGGKEGGGALQFDGTDDYVEVPDDDSLDITDAITIEVWIKPTIDGNRHDIIRKAYPYGMYILSSNNIAIEGYDDGADYVAASISATPYDGLWTHVVGTINVSANPQAILYINGEQKDTGYNANIDNLRSTADNLVIGSWVGTSNFFDGIIDEVRIYNRALSAEEIRYHYNRGGPVAHWKFDEGSGSTAYDETPNNNDGTLTNGPTWVEGKYGSALVFDGVDDYVSMPDVNVSPPYTVSAWIKHQGSGVRIAVFSRKGSKFTFGVDADNKITLRDKNGTFYYGSTLNQNEWYFVGLRANNATDFDIIINGKLDKSDVANSGDLDFSGNNFYMGYSTWVPYYFNGLIDDVRIYNYARTPEQILQDYNAGLSTHFR